MRRSCGRSAAEAGALPCPPLLQGRIRIRVAATLLLMVLAAGVAAWAGHEMPVYSSYYPQEIDIATVAPERALGLLRDGKIQAYLGRGLRVADEALASLGAVESLGDFVLVEVNPASPLARNDQAACALAAAVLNDLAGKGGDFVFHPYPVTPFHGDYLDHADRAASANARFFAPTAGAAPDRLRVKADGAPARSLVRPEWYTPGPDWDAAVEEVDAAGLADSGMVAMNGWLGPPWARKGWFHAHLLLNGALTDPDAKRREAADLRRLSAGDYDGAVERVNLEREIVALLTGGCRRTVAGYVVKRQYFSADYSKGIENIAYDFIDGLDSPMFIRTAKLKDFPWNGWLMLGTDAPFTAAWNPVAGFSDRFGRLMWFALGDPAALPTPDDSGWTMNRIADVRSVPGP